MNGHVERVKVWDLPLRLFHWALVISIALAFLSSEEDGVLNEWHVLSGWIAAVLITFRIAWGFIGGEHSRFSDFIRPSGIAHHVVGLLRGERETSLGHNPLGAVAVVILLALTAVTVWTGAFGGEAAEDMHETIAWVLLAMVAVHVIAVVAMSVLQGENLARAMVTGDKPAVRHPGASDARAPGPISLVLGALVIVATGYLILQFDPEAFSLRTAESFERRGEAGAEAMEPEHEDAEYD